MIQYGAVPYGGCLSARIEKVQSLLFFRQDSLYICSEEVPIALGKKSRPRPKFGTQLS